MRPVLPVRSLSFAGVNWLMRATYVPYTSQLRESPCPSLPTRVGEPRAGRRRPLLRWSLRRADADARHPDPERAARAAAHLPGQHLVGGHHHPARRGRGDAGRGPARRPLRQAAGAAEQRRDPAGGLGRLRPVRLARADAHRTCPAGPGDGLHPGRDLADARDHPAAADRHGDRVDERDPRCRRRHRPAAVGVDRPGPQLARPVLALRRAGRDGPAVDVRLRPPRPRRQPRPARPRRRGRAGDRAGVLPGRGLEGEHLGLG